LFFILIDYYTFANMKKQWLVVCFLIIPIFVFSQSQPKDVSKKKGFQLFNFSHTKISKNIRKKPFQNAKRKTKYMYPEWSFDVGIGNSNSFTDIGGGKWKGRDLFTDVQMKTTKLDYALLIEYKRVTRMGYVFSMHYTKFSGFDAYSPNTSRYARNNSFTHNIFEFGFYHKIYLLKNIYRNGWNYQEPLQYYAYYGLCTFVNNPVLHDPTGRYEPQKRISKLQLSIPLGFGIFYTFENHLRIGYDFSWRKTFTDYLDGFTTKFGNRKDSYSFSTITIGYALSKNQYKKRSNDNKKPFKLKVF